MVNLFSWDIIEVQQTKRKQLKAAKFLVSFFSAPLLFRSLKVGRNFAFGCVLVLSSFFFLFSMQNQVPKIIIGMRRVIYHRGRSTIFSGGGADLKKKLENFIDLYFRLTKLIFWAPQNHYKDPILTIFCAAGAVLKTRAKSAPFRHFLENFGQKKCVFWSNFELISCMKRNFLTSHNS